MRIVQILKILWISVATIIAAPIVLLGIIAFVGNYLSDPTRGEFLRNLVFEERAYEVTVDLVAEGEPLTITRTINCLPYLDGAMSLSLLKFVGQASLVDEAMLPS